MKAVSAENAGIKCGACENWYHYGKCSGLTKNTLKAMSSEDIDCWQCATCRVRKERQPLSATPTSGDKRAAGPTEANACCAEIVREIKKLGEVVTALKNKIDSVDSTVNMQVVKNAAIEAKLDMSLQSTQEIEKAMSLLSDKYDEILTKVDGQGKTVEQLKKKVDTLEAQVTDREKEIKGLQLAVDNAEQYSRRCNLEIHGLPEAKKEDLVEVVQNLAQKLELPVPSKEEIEAVHRLRAKEGKVPPIIVKFARRSVRDEWLEKRLFLRSESIFINENLTQRVKKLLWITKPIAKSKGYQYVWTKNGKVLARKAPGQTVIRVDSEADLDKL